MYTSFKHKKIDVESNTINYIYIKQNNNSLILLLSDLISSLVNVN